MMRLIGLSLLLSLVLCTCGRGSTEPAEDAQEKEMEAPAENWIPMFNGEDLSGWTIKFADQELGHNFRNTFVWENDMLRIKYDEYENFDDAYAHMYYDTPYTHYKMRFDYRFTGEQVPGGASWNVRNSGVMFHSQAAESNEFTQHFPVSVELQLLGGLSDGKPRPTGNVCTPGTAVVMGDSINYNHCISSSSPTYDGDEWLQAEAIVLGGEAMHFLIEGDTVLSFYQPHIGGGFIYENPERKDFRDAGINNDIDYWVSNDGRGLMGGYIALQAESHPIDFRNVELLVLPENQETK